MGEGEGDVLRSSFSLRPSLFAFHLRAARVKNLSEESKPTESTEPTTPTPDPPAETTSPLKPETQAKIEKPLPVFHLKLKAKMLEAILSAIAILVDEAAFMVSISGINLKAMDPGRVAMVVFNYPKEAFDEFSVEREGLIAFNLKEALKILRRTGKDDNAELTMQNTSAKLNLKLDSKAAMRLFDIPALETDEVEELPEPKLSHKARINLTAETLKGALEDAALVSDHVQIIVEPEVFQLKAAGDLTKADIKIVKGISADLLNIEVQEQSKATFSLKWLTEISKKLADLAETTTVQLATDMPIQIDAEAGKGSITFYTAPRIEIE